MSDPTPQERALLDSIVAGCTKIEGMWLASTDQRRMAKAQRLFWTAEDAPLSKLLSLYLACMAKELTVAAAEAVNPVVERILALIEKLKAMGPWALTTLNFLETLLTLLSGGAAPSTAGVTLKCGPDGCADCGECLDCAITCTVHSLAMQLQAKKCLDGGPAPR